MANGKERINKNLDTDRTLHRYENIPKHIRDGCHYILVEVDPISDYPPRRFEFVKKPEDEILSVVDDPWKLTAILPPTTKILIVYLPEKGSYAIASGSRHVRLPDRDVEAIELPVVEEPEGLMWYFSDYPDSDPADVPGLEAVFYDSETDPMFKVEDGVLKGKFVDSEAVEGGAVRTYSTDQADMYSLRTVMKTPVEYTHAPLIFCAMQDEDTMTAVMLTLSPPEEPEDPYQFSYQAMVHSETELIEWETGDNFPGHSGVELPTWVEIYAEIEKKSDTEFYLRVKAIDPEYREVLIPEEEVEVDTELPVIIDLLFSSESSNHGVVVLEDFDEEYTEWLFLSVAADGVAPEPVNLVYPN